MIYGTGLGSSPAGTRVAFNGIAATLLYTSATQVAAVVPYALTGTTAEVTVAYQGENSAAFVVPVAPSAPGIFTSDQTGAGQAAAINVSDGTVNSAVNPVKIGDTSRSTRPAKARLQFHPLACRRARYCR